MRRTRQVLATALVGALAWGMSGCGAPGWQKQLVSTNAAGTDSANGESRFPRLSPDGTKVLFTSDASNLGPIDTNGLADLYLRDLTTGTTTLVSVNAAGTDGGNAPAHGWAFSPDGTKVAFMSRATNLTSPETSEVYDKAFVRDLVTGTTTHVSAGMGRPDAANDFAWVPQFSPDGQRVLVGYNKGTPPSPTGSGGIYERDLTTGELRKVADGGHATYSPAGDLVAFQSGSGEVALWSRSTGATRILTGVLPGKSYNYQLVFSADGSKLAFSREYTSEDDYVIEDVYVHDLATRRNTRVTVGIDGGGSNNSPSRVWGFHPTDSNQVLFSSHATNLVAGETDPWGEDILVRNLAAGTTTLVAANAASISSSTAAHYLGDGSKIAFVSLRDNLGPTDTNTWWDVYVRDMTTGTATLVSTNAAGDDAGNGDSGQYAHHYPSTSRQPTLSVSADGLRIAFGSDANNLGPTDSDREYWQHDIYVATLAQ